MELLSVRYPEVKDVRQTTMLPLISQFALIQGDFAFQVVTVPSLSCRPFPFPAAVSMTT